MNSSEINTYVQKAHARTLTSDEAILLADELVIWHRMALKAEASIHRLQKFREEIESLCHK